MRGGSVSAAATALAVSAVVWHFASPHWTLKQVQAAAAARDAAALAEHIDFPALRDSLKAEAAAAMLAEAQADDGLGPLGAALGAALLDPMIDGLVSPAGIATLFADETGRGAGSPLATDFDAVAIERDGFSTFRVVGGPGAGALVFRRHGYAWKLAAVDLPPGALAAAR